ncbi:TRAP-type C4-dicarboxylate transport system, substrate-binding protein [Alteribacillus persepolensis]|uniref:TRAP-type C4-dicarboxylate transport system, substrate-binding protein n=1 Tax=Alteribacillus persepolensis TaxID=568899 RepID=A0A1G8JBE9_9BACI|nr:TRAP transporter substrate-binding protein DctP [Alteribacillus persepolensis]SDI28565.1 TRAP-type C4-dicarboxylate transport system, substrate-binding protein [Alteribacillus persepolensis]
MKAKFIFIYCVLLSSMLIFAACSSSDEAATEGGEGNTVTLNAVSFLAKDHPLTETLHDWVEAVEETTEGRVEINWRGGADVIPIGEQFEAMQSGAIDVNFTYIGQYQSMAPESLSIPLSQLEPWEERESGFYDFMVERHKELNTMYLGRWLTGSPRLWLNEPIDEVADLEGMSVRSAPNYNRFFDELGINSKMIDPSEVYTSLQTGVVEGFVYGGFNGPRKDGWTDSTKYVLDHPFWTQNCVILMNDDKWNDISEDDQEAIVQATAEYEKDMVAHYEELDEKEIEELQAIGVELFELPQEEADKFLETAYETEWQHLEGEVPELVDELRKLTTKEE